MSFNLAEFVKNENIEYIEIGPNVQKGNINIRCPFCVDDPSFHLGISIETGYWGCWRESGHRGKKPHRLLHVLLRRSFEQIDQLVSEGSARVDGFDGLDPKALFDRQVGPEFKFEPVESDVSFRYIVDSGIRMKFFRYVVRRFNYMTALEVIEKYDLRCAVTGRMKDRVIIPINHGHELIGWTGRAVGPATLRYISFPEGPTIKRTIFRYDALQKGGRTLFITEGPFDAMKVDFFGDELGCQATCLFGKAPTEPQIELLHTLRNRFDNFAILLDPDAVHTALALSAKISFLRPKIFSVPDETEDPGALNRSQVHNLVRSTI